MTQLATLKIFFKNEGLCFCYDRAFILLPSNEKILRYEFSSELKLKLLKEAAQDIDVASLILVNHILTAGFKFVSSDSRTIQNGKIIETVQLWHFECTHFNDLMTTKKLGLI